VKQTKNSLRLVPVVLLSILAPASPARLSATPPVRTLVSAAASLQDSLNEIIPLYEKTHPDNQILLNLGGSGTLELQIEQGAPADLFIAAAPQPMDALESKGLLLPGTRVNLLENQIVLIAPKGATNVSNFQDLARSDVRLVAMGDPRSVPAGMYAQKVLEALGLYESVRQKAVLGADVRQVLGYVETGSADAGIVYATDAAISQRVKIVAFAPANSTPPVIYPAAVLRASAHQDAARNFLLFLQSDQARAIFRRYGFRIASP